MRIGLALLVALAALAAAPGASAAGALAIAPDGSDSNPCTPSAPCRSLDRAYHRAAPGQVVTVAGGRYRGERIGADAAKRGPAVVVLRAARGARPRFGDVTVDGARYVELDGLTLDTATVASGDHVTLRNVVQMAFYVFAPSSYVSIIGGSVGPSHNYNSYIAVPDDSVSAPSRHILIDGVRFHDVTRVPPQHVECLMLAQGVDVVIRNSVFTRCAVFDLFVTWWYFRPKVGPPTRVTIANNVFDVTRNGSARDGYYSVEWADYVNRASLPWTSFLLRGNRWRQAVQWGPARHENFRVIGNVGEQPQSGCASDIAFAQNVFYFAGGRPARCGPTDRTAPSEAAARALRP